MIRRSLRARFTLIFSALMGALLVLVVGTVVAVRARDQRAMMESHADGFAQTTNGKLCDTWQLYYRSGSYKFREIVHSMMRLNEDLHRVLILSVSGEVLFDSFESSDLALLPEMPKRRLEDPELVAAAARPELWKKRERIEGLGQALMIGAPYFEAWGRHPYSVLYLFTYDKMQRRVLDSLRPTLLLMGIALAVVALVSWWLAGRVARPLLELTDDVRLFSEEREHRPIEIRTGDEIQELADTFNRMAGRIRQQVENLEKANRELATLDRLKTDLLANVSHELRTPLAAIRGYVEFIREGELGPLSDSQKKGLEVCLRNADRLAKTINMLLDFSRMELGRVAIRPAPFQIGRLVAQVAAGLENEARKRGIRLVTDVEKGLKAVEADRDRLTQVLENLVTNALKFTPDYGSVEVGARSVDGRSRVEVSVCDTGEGIPASERSRIFDKFYQTDASASRRFGGIGLGLSIVKSILDAHQTSIVVDERPGGGTVFRFTLPAVEARTDSGAFHAFPASREGPAEILAIDDDADFLAILNETLTKEGFRVRTAMTAQDGLALARERTPRLILLDIRLPDRDGLDVLQALKEGPETREIPILVLSVVDERLEGLRLGALDYMVKPVEKGRLIETVRRALSEEKRGEGASGGSGEQPAPEAVS